ncbi:MAG: AsmA-like C-terminal region-containing protein [Saprospiraceae bacterium]
MTDNKKTKHSIKNRLLQLLLVVVILLLLVMSVGWYLLRSNHPYLLQKIKTTALEKYQANLDLTGYQLEFTKPFPSIQFQFQGLRIAPENNPQHPFLKFSQANSTFHPWDLISGNYNAQPFVFDSVWVHLHKDTLDKSNLDFGESKEEISSPKKSNGIDFELKKLPHITIKYLDFHRVDEYRKKRQWAKLHQVVIQPKRNVNKDWFVSLVSDCYFEGILFNEKDGGFLVKERGKLDLNIELKEEGTIIQLEDSSLEIYDKTKFLLDGKFTLADTNHFQLQIANEGVTMKTVMPMLSGKINRILKDIKIDQPIVAKFSIDKFLKSGKKEVLKVEFATKAAQLIFQGVEMNKVMLQGNFSNDCDNDGVGDFATACLTVQQLDGDILGVLPTQLSGIIEQLNDPLVKASGKMNLSLPRLNKLLVSNDKFTFTDGQAIVDFEYEGELMNLLNSPFDEQDIRLVGDAYFDDMTVKTYNIYAPSPSLSGHLSFDENLALLDDMSLDWMGSNVSISGRVGNLPEFLFFDDEAINMDLSLRFDELDLDHFIENTPEKIKEKETIETQSNSSKHLNFQRLERITRRLASSVNGQVELQVDKLIFDSLFVTNLQTKVRLFTPRRAEYVDSFMIQVNQLSANFMGNTPFYLDLGLSRDSIVGVQIDLNLPSGFEPAQVFLPKNIRLTQGDVSMKISTLAPLRFLLQPQQLIPNLKFKGIINFDKTEIESDLFSWPVRKLSGPISFDNQQLQLDDLGFSYEGSPFLVKGKIDNYAFFLKENSEKAQVDLKVKGAFWNLKNENKTAQKKAISPAKLFQSLDTIFQLVTGKVDLSLDSILLEKQTIYPFLLQAQLVADELNSEQHLLQVDSFNLGFGKKNNIKGNAKIKNPSSPIVEAHFKTRMKFKKLGEFLVSDFIEMKHGYFNMDLDYQSPLFDTINAENYLLKADVKGIAQIVDGEIFYNYRDFTFKKIYAHFSFDEKAIFIRDVDLEVNENRMFASGQSLDFFPFFILPNRRTNIELNVASPRFDFGGFTAPHGLGKDSLVLKANAILNQSLAVENVGQVDTVQSIMVSTGSLIDQLLDQGSMEMTTVCDELIYNEFIAENVSGKISLQPDTVQLNDLSMDVANGKFTVDGSISDVALHQPKMKVKVQMEKNDVREIFRQFEDFGQNQIGYKNMNGLTSANIEFQAEVNSNYSILPETMFGEVNFKLTDGQILGIGSLKKLSGFLFKNRQLDSILIDTLETRMHIRGSDIYVDNFFLHSSSFDFGVEGIYSLGKENNTRILFTVPVSNLYRRHLTRKQLRSGTAKRKGLRILIEARQRKDRMKFRWKPIKFRKEKYRLPKLKN